MSPDALANYYELPRDEIQEMLEKYGAKTPDDSRSNTLPLYFVETDGKITVIGITKKPYSQPEEFFYVDLVPQGDKRFLVNFSVKNSYPQWPNFRISPTGYWDDEIYIKENFIPEAGQHYSIPVILEDSSPTDKIHIGITRFLIRNVDDWANSSYDFFPISTALASSTWLLALNKTLRLAKACGMTPLEAQRALTRLNTTGKLSDAAVLHRFCEFLLYRKRYNISSDDALILSGANISTVSYDGQLSQFDRMFNNPPLNGEVYSLGELRWI